MKTIFKPIALNEKSPDVRVLHKALEALGLPVASKETGRNRAGEDTLKKVRALQAKLNVPADESVLADEATLLAIYEAMKKRGLTSAGRSFTATGKVKTSSGEAKRRQQLFAYEVDLRGISAYRDLKSMAEIDKNGGFAFLGQTISDNQGNYSITFYDWQYRRSDLKKASVIVFSTEGKNVTGYSRIISTEDHPSKRIASGLDVVIIKKEDKTEYETMMKKLGSFTKKNKTSLYKIAKLHEQAAFAAEELEIGKSNMDIAASAELLTYYKDGKQQLHEMLYGIGRQNIMLSWEALYKKPEEELREAIRLSIEKGIVRKFSDKEIDEVLLAVGDICALHMLDDTEKEDKNTLNAMLSSALPEKEQRVLFVKALRDFKGGDYSEFWEKHLPSQPVFRENPQLISALQLNQQLTMLTGNHQALVREIQINKGLTSIFQLIQLEKSELAKCIKNAGIPDFIEGTDEKEKINKYIDQIQGLLNAAFPTQRIFRMLEKQELPIKKISISKKIREFLSNNEKFDFACSRIHDFDIEIEKAAGKEFEETKRELLKIQRVFQVSTRPEAMIALMEHNLHSAYTIASIPRKSFIKTYGKVLGGDMEAFAIHQRASHISASAEMTAMRIMDNTHTALPASIMGGSERNAVTDVIKRHLPNYSELFGSPDMYECEQCRSVFSAAAYFVDLLRFLWRSEPNGDGKTPLDILNERRPDLCQMLLDCENTNTVIPYIDLVNEIMEYYAANGSMNNFQGYNTGEITAGELRANPQNFNLEAYRILNNAKYPFTLPYNQPLDMIRTYGDHLGVSRFEAMKAINTAPNNTAKKAIEAEYLGISETEYTILTGETFNGTADSTQLPQFFGLSDESELENLSCIREFLSRSGITYVDLLELIKTPFINPYRSTLDFLERMFSYSAINANEIYTLLKQIKAGVLPANDERILQVLARYNANECKGITPDEFVQWVSDHFHEFRQVITIYQPSGQSSLDTARLKTMEEIYEGSPDSGIGVWSKIHRLIRLWRKLGWSMQETGIILAALGEEDITPTTISKLASACMLKKACKLSIEQLGVLWGNIDTHGENSLFRKLFINKTVQQIDETFQADASGNYLQDSGSTLADHEQAIRAAFNLSEEDLDSILKTAKVLDSSKLRRLDKNSDNLNIQNLSTIYRYVVLSKALKIKTIELCKIITIFNASPFSIWDVQSEGFTSVLPDATYEFFNFADSIKKAGFKTSVLEYIFTGMLPADSVIGLDKERILQAAKTIRQEFAYIEQNHPDLPLTAISIDIISSKLLLTYPPEIVNRFMEIVNGTAYFETITDNNLGVKITDDLISKIIYFKGSGRLVCKGIMSDAEKTKLSNLADINDNFRNAVDELFSAPETFINENFNGAFIDLLQAIAVLLDRPLQPSIMGLEGKQLYIYQQIVPVIKNKLRKDSINHQIASLIDLDDESTALLTARDIDSLVLTLCQGGFSGIYSAGTNCNNPILEKVDGSIDFSWGENSPHPSISADNFSVKWKAYIGVPVGGEYTLLVDVEEADDTFNLYLDNVLILSKAASDPAISWERCLDLTQGKMYLLTLEYADTSRNAGIRLRWKSSMTAPEIIKPEWAYPESLMNGFVEKSILLHRAAKFIQGFGISRKELQHFITYGADFGGIDFYALDAGSWKRILNYSALRNSVPQAQALLTDVFSMANRLSPIPTVDSIIPVLSLATAWDETGLSYIINSWFALSVDDFKNEIALNRISEAIKIITKTRISIKSIEKLSSSETDFNMLYETAQMLRNTVKLMYDEEEWLNIAGRLMDNIRENQKRALINYLLTQPAIKSYGAIDADSLFEYFLIDVQMGAKMDTSRIVQANSSIQMFVNRCLLNLEDGVSPSAIDNDRWQWMKNYRVWEANRKVFIYPENMLEPEWRKNSSEFFKELESYLVENDITGRSVEQGLRNYLASLNEIGNLEVIGFCKEDDQDRTFILHVFARTHNAPYKYYYRRRDRYGKWSAWESVQVDIKCTEEGNNSGTHLIPVVWKNRLFLFWPEFTEEKKQRNADFNLSGATESGPDLNQYTPETYCNIRLAWSEYSDSIWSPKQVSKQSVKIQKTEEAQEKDLLFTARVNTETQELSIKCYDASGQCVYFTLSDVQSPVQVSDQSPDNIPSIVLNNEDKYSYFFSARKASGGQNLELNNNVYLRNSENHKLLPEDTKAGLNISPHNPFFYIDANRTYFVRSAGIKLIEKVKYPNKFKPYMQILADAAQYDMKDAKPDVFGTNTYNSIKQPLSIKRKDTASMLTQIAEAFNPDVLHWLNFADELEFHTFHHPFSSKFVTRLNQGGIKALLGCDTEDPNDGDDAIKSDDGSHFEEYAPDPLLVKKPEASDDGTYYKENVSFDVYGANSLYNWELFFYAPLYVAIRLSKNGRYEEAMEWFHYIFDPTTDVNSNNGSDNINHWGVLPFRKDPSESLEDQLKHLSPNSDRDVENSIIGEWRDNPFDPHLIASNRQLAYMKFVILKYVENLLSWGDSLFRQFTRESVYEALQIYVIADHILGAKPEYIPRQGKYKAESFASLSGKWDDFSNALISIENIFPYSSDIYTDTASSGPSLLGMGSSLYFCIPPNEKMLEYWDTVADRLFKIRHCQDIGGTERYLALFAPPISPESIIQATAQGLSLSGILMDMSSPAPIYRFSYLIQKANEFCAEVKALGSALLAALEKKDAEELNRLHASRETEILENMTAIKEMNILDAKVRRESLIKARDAAEFRLQHYIKLMGNETIQVPPSPALEGPLSADSQLPADTNIPEIISNADDSLVNSGESGVKLITHEERDIRLNQAACNDMVKNMMAEIYAGEMGLIPQFNENGEPLGVGVTTGFGGRELSWYAKSLATMFATSGQLNSMAGAAAAKMASYIRREQDWTLQGNLAEKEIIQLDKQITSADIQVQIAKKDLENHARMVKDARDLEIFLKEKFTNQQLYHWMREQVFELYKKSYDLAYEMAKKAEKAYMYETGDESASFIQYGNWDNSKQGLVAGEKLQLALKQVEKAYLENNRRELELKKNVSLALLNPLALVELKETGKCCVKFPEEIFDLDFQGHYFRRIKSVRLSIPCIAGPYTTVNCSLRLIKNTTRINTLMSSSGNYEHNNDEGLWTDDDRFSQSNVPVTSIATCAGLNDSGMFEFNFRDERYLPFEGAGIISSWEVELSTEKELRQFDYSTIPDVIFHIDYTARESNGTFKTSSATYIKNYIMNKFEFADQPFMHMFSMKHDFCTEWHRFLYPGVAEGEQILTFTIGKERMPFITQNRKIHITGLDILADTKQTGDYNLIISTMDKNNHISTSSQILMHENEIYGNTNTVMLTTNNCFVNVENIDITRQISFKLKYCNVNDYKSLVTNPDEVNDILLVLHYKLESLQ